MGVQVDQTGQRHQPGAIDDLGVGVGLTERQDAVADEDVGRLAAEVADSVRSTIVEQVANGVSVRMAVLYLLLGGAPS